MAEAQAQQHAPGQRRGRRQDAPVEEKQFDERTLHIDRVARVVKGGRRFRFRALVVVGDHKGKVGIGISKGADVTAAVTKATDVAKKHMITVPLYKGTLPHEAEAKVSGARILLKPASQGTGLIAGGVVRTILEVAGVNNALVSHWAQLTRPTRLTPPLLLWKVCSQPASGLPKQQSGIA